MTGILNTHTFGNRGAGHFCVGGNNWNKSNEEITIAASQGDLKAGQPMGELTGTPGTYHPLDPAAVDGTEVFAGILWEDRPDDAAAQTAVIVARDQVVNGNALQYANSLTQPQLDTMVGEAEALDIIVRF